MWHSKWKLLKNSIQVCRLSDHLTSYLTVGSWKCPENCIFVYCFIEGSVSILNDIGSWTLAWTMVLTYIFIFWTRIGERSTLDPPPLWGNPHPKHWRKKSGHTIYQMKALRKLYSNMPIKWFCMDTVLSYTLKYCRGGSGQSPSQNIWKKKYLVMWHIKWDPLRNL